MRNINNCSSRNCKRQSGKKYLERKSRKTLILIEETWKLVYGETSKEIPLVPLGTNSAEIPVGIP